MPKPIPPAIVAEIKAIIFQDWRERNAAGYLYLSHGIFKRLAAHYGVSVDLVESIRLGRRGTKIRASEDWAYRGITVDKERLERQKERVIRDRVWSGLQGLPRRLPPRSVGLRGRRL